MPLVAAEADAMLDFEGGRLVYLSVHTADPGTTGANEGAVARQAITWNPSSGGAKAGQQLSYTPPAGTYTHGGYWSAPTGGTYRGSFQFAASKTVGSGDTLKVTPNLTEVLS